MATSSTCGRFALLGGGPAEDEWQTGLVLFRDPPPSACWQHQGLRVGFEVTYFSPESSGMKVEGTTTGRQDEDIWVMSYRLALDPSWTTLRAHIAGRTASGPVERFIESDGRGHWQLDGADASDLTGCRDVDLESSAMTNALPVHRLGLAVGEHAATPAAYIRLTGAVERLDQHYVRLNDQGAQQNYDYEAPAFDFKCRLIYDQSGLVLDYPGIALRVG